MKHLALSFVILLATGAAAQAACFADYKAKKDDPLQLQYGVAEVYGDCTTAQARSELAARLAADGWQLLEVVSTFDESGLEERRGNAGEYFLRY